MNKKEGTIELQYKSNIKLHCYCYFIRIKLQIHRYKLRNEWWCDGQRCNRATLASKHILDFLIPIHKFHTQKSHNSINPRIY